MPLIKMNAASVGGGVKVAYGTHMEQINANVGKTISCGFRPRYIFFGFQYQGAQSLFQIFEAFDGEVDDSKFAQFYDGNGREVSLTNTTALGIGQVTDDGCTVVNPGYAIKWLYWLATT